MPAVKNDNNIMSASERSGYTKGDQNTNAFVFNVGMHPLVNFNFMLRVEGLMDIPCKSVSAFTKENEFEYIKEGGLNDYVHMKRRPISKPFTFTVERYITPAYIVDPLALGAELVLPVILMISRDGNRFDKCPRTFTFTGCTVISKEFGSLNSEKSGLLTESITIAYREMLCFDLPGNPDSPTYKMAAGITHLGKDPKNDAGAVKGDAIYNQSEQRKAKSEEAARITAFPTGAVPSDNTMIKNKSRYDKEKRKSEMGSVPYHKDALYNYAVDTKIDNKTVKVSNMTAVRGNQLFEPVSPKERRKADSKAAASTVVFSKDMTPSDRTQQKNKSLYDKEKRKATQSELAKDDEGNPVYEKDGTQKRNYFTFSSKPLFSLQVLKELYSKERRKANMGEVEYHKDALYNYAVDTKIDNKTVKVSNMKPVRGNQLFEPVSPKERRKDASKAAASTVVFSKKMTPSDRTQQKNKSLYEKEKRKATQSELAKDKEGNPVYEADGTQKRNYFTFSSKPLRSAQFVRDLYNSEIRKSDMGSVTYHEGFEWVKDAASKAPTMNSTPLRSMQKAKGIYENEIRKGQMNTKAAHRAAYVHSRTPQKVRHEESPLENTKVTPEKFVMAKSATPVRSAKAPYEDTKVTPEKFVMTKSATPVRSAKAPLEDSKVTPEKFEMKKNATPLRAREAPLEKTVAKKREWQPVKR